MQPDGFGYRARVGLVYIATSVVMEPECYCMAPDGVAILTSRIPLAEITIEGLADLGGVHVHSALDATRLLANAQPTAIVFACTAGSFVGGAGYDQQVTALLQEAAPGVPIATTTTASVRALHAVKAETVALLLPYPQPVADRAVQYFSDTGFEVAGSMALGCVTDHDIAAITPEAVYRLARELDSSEADAIFLSCTNLRTIAVIEALERDLGKPVVSAIQASFWDALRLSGVGDCIDHYGSLLRL